MGYDNKYGTVTTEFGNIPDDEPVIVFRARDVTTDQLLAYYALLVMEAGAPLRHLSLLWEAHRQFRAWREANPGEARLPDSERSRAWMGEMLDVRGNQENTARQGS